MLKASVLPLEPLAVGVKLYADPAVTLVGGVPVIVGGEDAGACAVTVILKDARDAAALPSLTPMTMALYVPSWLEEAVPVNAPVEVLNDAQDGLFCTEKVRVLPSGSLAAGLKEYAEPATTVVAGDPEIVGGRLAAVPPVTVIEKAGRDAEENPSLTLMTMLEVVAAVVGLPLSRPLNALNVAHAGRLAIVNLRKR